MDSSSNSHIQKFSRKSGIGSRQPCRDYMSLQAHKQGKSMNIGMKKDQQLSKEALTRNLMGYSLMDGTH